MMLYLDLLIQKLWARLQANCFVLYHIFYGITKTHRFYRLEITTIRIFHGDGGFDEISDVVIRIAAVHVPDGVRFSDTPYHAGIKRRVFWRHPHIKYYQEEA